MTIKKSDLIVPEVLQDAVKGAFSGMQCIYGSPAVTSDFGMLASRGGEKVTVPYFGTIGEFEDLVAEGDALTPSKLVMTSEEATVMHSGKAFDITQWAQLAAKYADPYAEAARQIVVAAQRHADAKLIAAASANLPAEMIHDVTGAGKQIDYDIVVDAKMKWGDEQEDIALMAMHSKVAGDLLKLKDNNGRPLLTMPSDGKLGNFVGIPLKISDRLAAVNANYTTLIFKRGALAYWANGTPTVKTDDDILADSVVAAVHLYWVAHRYTRLPGSTKGGVVAIKHK